MLPLAFCYVAVEACRWAVVTVEEVVIVALVDVHDVNCGNVDASIPTAEGWAGSWDHGIIYLID